VTDNDVSLGERQIKTILNDVKGQLNGIANQQMGLGRKYDQIIERLTNLEEEWRQFRKGFVATQTNQ